MSKLHVDESDWKVDRSELRKTYRYTGLSDDSRGTLLQIAIRTSRSNVSSALEGHVFFLISPSPWPSVPRTGLTARLAIIDDPTEYPFVTISASLADDGSLLLTSHARSDAAVLLQAISQCKPMRLQLMHETHEMVSLPIPNDDQFLGAAKMSFK